MKIEQSSVTMNATHDYLYERDVAIESSFRSVLSDVSETGATESDNSSQERLLFLLQTLISRVIEIISGKEESQATGLDGILQTDTPTQADAIASQGWTGRAMTLEWETEMTETIHEHESTEFCAAGKVCTADGKTIDFTMGLDMCRDYSCQRTVRQSGSMQLTDPLVINYGGNAAELSGQRFDFDLDADGVSEQIPALAGGSAWLAFDSNADGRVNNGSELFGTASGNGFADLARLDEDGNHWLDEADSAFFSLGLWEHDASGADTLTSLADKGIGAIYLGSAQTPFALADADNDKQGYIRASGVYLREDGSAGSVQQVDLAV